MERERAELLHRVSSLPGQSGAAIILEGSGDRRIVGVHKGGVEREVDGRKEQVNWGRVMTAELIAALELEARRMGSPASLSAPQPPGKQPPLPAESNVQAAARLRAEGEAKFKEGKFEQAIEKCRRAVKLNPTDALACYSLGRALNKTKKYEGRPLSEEGHRTEPPPLGILRQLRIGTMWRRAVRESYQKLQQGHRARPQRLIGTQQHGIGPQKYK